MAHARVHATTGRIASRPGAAAVMIKLRAAEWDVPVHEEAGRLSLTIWGCELRLSEEETSLRLDLSGPERRLVDTLRDSATGMMAEAGLTVVWDRVDVGALTPGMSLAQVASVTDRSPGFVRLRLSGAELGRLGTDDGLHFRLLIPPKGRMPVWPRVAATGRTVWPQGKDALHRPVYTVAEHGTRDGTAWIDLDVFRHPGSPTCDWIAAGPEGATVGVIGPGGGGCPQADRLWLFGDETALPAIARMLPLARGEVEAMLRVAPEDMGALTQDPRARRCGDLLGALLAHPDLQNPVEGGQVWFAGHADQARAARAHLTARGWRKQDFCCAAYWG